MSGANRVPREFLALIPLMQRGSDPGIIKRWLEIADAETDLHRRGDSALALVDAELVGTGPLWQTALEGFTMIQSPLIAQLLAGAEAKAAREAKLDAVLRVVKQRFPKAPEEVMTAIKASTDLEQLDRWLDLALTARSLRHFRQQAGI